MKRSESSAVDRKERLDEIRQEIAAGTYETPERLAAAVDGLLDDLTARAEIDAPFRPKQPR